MPENAPEKAQLISRPAGIAFCCVLPNAILLTIAVTLWAGGFVTLESFPGMNWLTNQQTQAKITDVIGIGPVIIFLTMLILIVSPNLMITFLISGRPFRSRREAFLTGLGTCLLVPLVTLIMLLAGSSFEGSPQG